MQNIAMKDADAKSGVESSAEARKEGDIEAVSAKEKPRGDYMDFAYGSSEYIQHDKALDLLQTQLEDFNPDSEEAKMVLKKIDLIILPLLCIIYTVMLTDKSSLSFAGIMGIKEDCNLSGHQYSWLGSIIYFGYLAGDIPAMMLLQRYPVDKVFSVVVIIWGAVVALHAACGEFASLAVLRFLLGFGEVFTAPTIIQILGSWYTKEEQIIRLPIWYMCYGFAYILGGFLAWCVYQAEVLRWQALFILLGGITFSLGVIFYFCLPSSPTRAHRFTEKQRVIALERVRKNKTGTEVWRYNGSQLKEAFLDPRLYIIFLLLVSSGLPSGGIAVFGPSIISGFGFSAEESTLLSMGPGGAAVAGVLLSTLVAKYSNRTTAGTFIFVVSIIGVVMMLAIPASNYNARYGGYVLALQFPNAIPFLMAMMTAGTSGSTKKLAFSASYQLGYAVGNIIGPQTYSEQYAPEYYPAKYTMLAFLVFGTVLFIAFGILHFSWNKQREQQTVKDTQNGVTHEIVHNEEFMDKTDFNIRSFVYPL